VTAVEDHEEEVQELGPAPWSWARLAGIAVAGFSNMLGTIGLACDEVSNAIAAHIAFKDDRRDFADSVLRDVERITA